MLSVFASLVLSDVWPNMGIHDGDNKVVWTVGCCDGDLITVDFRDEVGDGNGGNGLLKIYNKTSGLTSSYYLGPFYGTWKAFGPYCAPQCPSENPNCHNLTFTSDANAHETTVTVTDSFGLIKGMGGMEDFPIAFSTIAPAKFCMAGQSEFDMARATAEPPATARAPLPSASTPAARAVPHAHAPPAPPTAAREPLLRQGAEAARLPLPVLPARGARGPADRAAAGRQDRRHTAHRLGQQRRRRASAVVTGPPLILIH